MTLRTDGRRSEAGFALVLALLTLLMLTFLGLSLALTTSTELQIANNYRLTQQSRYIAEAGLELAKRLLLKQTPSSLLPTARTTADMTVGRNPSALSPALWSLARNDEGGAASRNWENWECDRGQGYQGVGNGVVLDHQNFTYPFQHTSSYYTAVLNGAFTAWVRRAVVTRPDGDVEDDKGDHLVITVEGTAPFIDAASTSAYAAKSRAVSIIQVELQVVDPDCENDFAGQSGNTALNSGYDACQALKCKKDALGNTQCGVPNATNEINPGG